VTKLTLVKSEQTTSPNVHGFNAADAATARKLVSRGFEQQPDVPRAFWLNGHCLYIHTTKGLIEL
jgi:hypothetical protein